MQLAATHQLPAIYGICGICANWRPDRLRPGVRRHGSAGATFVDKILKGADARDIPVEITTKFALAINLKASAALGLDVPPTILAAADEVIE